MFARVTGPVQKAMRIERIPDACPFAKRETNFRTARANVGAIGLQLRGSKAIFFAEIRRRIDAIGRHIRIELEGLHMQGNRNIIANSF